MNAVISALPIIAILTVSAVCLYLIASTIRKAVMSMASVKDVFSATAYIAGNVLTGIVGNMLSVMVAGQG